jgi:hypothetical protein
MQSTNFEARDCYKHLTHFGKLSNHADNATFLIYEFPFPAHIHIGLSKELIENVLSSHSIPSSKLECEQQLCLNQFCLFICLPFRGKLKRHKIYPFYIEKEAKGKGNSREKPREK